MKKLKKQILSFLYLFILIFTLGCREEKDLKNGMVEANASGIMVDFSTLRIETDNRYFWINDDAVLGFSSDKETWGGGLTFVASYYYLDSDLIDDIALSISDSWWIEKEKEDIYSLVINFLKNNKTKYKFIARSPWSDDIVYLFNRISDINY